MKKEPPYEFLGIRQVRYFRPDEYPEKKTIKSFISEAYSLTPSKQGLVPYKIHVFGPDRLKEKTAQDQEIARRFDKEFFDGDRKHGYGGFSYDPKFWQPVVPSFINFWNIKRNDSLLDVGCAKGFMLYDFKQIIPNLEVKGIDISNYAIKNALPEIKSNLLIADAKEIPFEDNSFDHVIAINTIHNLNEDDCAKSLKEITRVSKKNSFITVDAYRNEEEKKTYVCLEFNCQNNHVSK